MILRHVLGCAGEIVAVKGDKRARTRFPVGRSHRSTPSRKRETMSDRFSATYLIETDIHLAEAAAVIAGEASTATFVKLTGEAAERVERLHAARVEQITELSESDRPSLPVARPTKGHFRRAEVTISWPLANTGPSIPNILAAVAGNLFECREVTGLRLLDLDLPAALLGPYQGPQFGIEGTREVAGIHDRPLIGTIIKPSVGLTPVETAELVEKLVEGGIDFIKDDELMADPPHCPFAERVRAVMAVIRRRAERTGRKAMFAFNITGEIEEMLERHDLVLREGGSCVMVSLNWIGTTGVGRLRRHAALPIHGHRNGWGFFSRCPALGFEFKAWHKVHRLAGADHIHVNGLRNKFSESDESVIASARACLEPLFRNHPDPLSVMPVFSSGQTVRQAADTFAAIGTVDLIHAAGGGIMAHPGGIAAGVAALRQAWEAAVTGVAIEDAARTHAELRQALQKFAG
jgi:ribulose-bisphosphate carboxylase large chain